MEPEYDPALMTEPRAGAPAPLWVWLLVVALGAISAYAVYAAMSEHQLYLQGESVRVDLAQERDRLKANVADLGRQVEQANRSRSDVENALKQSRANTESASAQIGDLQGQVGQMREKTGDLERARSAAEASTKEAVSAKEALEREVTALKGQLAQTQKKLNAALADLTKERQQISPAPVPPPASPKP